MHQAFDMFISWPAPARRRPADPDSTPATIARRVRCTPPAMKGMSVFLPIEVFALSTPSLGSQEGAKDQGYFFARVA